MRLTCGWPTMPRTGIAVSTSSGVMANVMRRVLVDYARAHKGRATGAEGCSALSYRTILRSRSIVLDEVVQMDEALKHLESENPRQARVVELRYFGGLSIEQIASLLEIAPRSVKRDWSLARIWLFRELQQGGQAAEK